METNTLENKLRKRWFEFVVAHAQNQQSFKHFFIEIQTSYTQRTRYFHTLAHLDHIFQCLEATEVSDPVCHWATWFHDIIYLPGSGRNELNSAQKAAAVLSKLGVPESEITSTSKLILATKSHASVTSPQGNLFLDADMSILGASWKIYDQYLTNIRKEFKRMPACLFKKGRRRFIQDMLSRENIFITEYYRNQYENAARENLLRELEWK